MSQADKTARIHRFVEGFRRCSPGYIVKIDQQISTKNDIEIAVDECIGSL
jgi:hypothetical protein